MPPIGCFVTGVTVVSGGGLGWSVGRLVRMAETQANVVRPADRSAGGADRVADRLVRAIRVFGQRVAGHRVRVGS